MRTRWKNFLTWLKGQKKNARVALTVIGVLMFFFVLSDVKPTPPAEAGAAVQGSGREGIGQYRDGTYEGKASAYNGDIVMSVEIKQGWIHGLAIKSTQDDAEYLLQAKALLPKIVEKQSTSLDAVSGATFSSNGILDAVDRALQEASKK